MHHFRCYCIVHTALFCSSMKRQHDKRSPMGSARSVLTFTNPNYNGADAGAAANSGHRMTIWKRFKYDKTQVGCTDSIIDCIIVDYNVKLSYSLTHRNVFMTRRNALKPKLIIPSAATTHRKPQWLQLDRRAGLFGNTGTGICFVEKHESEIRTHN